MIVRGGNYRMRKAPFVSTLVLMGSGFLLIPTLFAANPLATQLWEVALDQGSGTVEFNAVGRPSALKIHGKGGAPKGLMRIENGILQGSTQFALDTLDTGIPLRNRHMKEKYLETGKFPQAKLTFDPVNLGIQRIEDLKTEKTVPFVGKLSLHGVEKPVKGIIKVSLNGNTALARTEFGLKISDFQVPTPGFAGITMAEDVGIVVESRAPLRMKTP